MSSIRFSYGKQIGLHHFALYRSWLNGLDMAEMGERYIGQSDPRIIKNMLDGLRANFVQAARRANLPRYARLLAQPLRKDRAARRTPSSAGHVGQSHSEATSVEDATPAPDLETFRQDHDPQECMTESELLQLFLEHYPEKKKGGGSEAHAQDAHLRRTSWIQAQESALFWIREFLVSDPLPADSIDGWLDGSALAHLKAASIHSVGDLKAYIETHGKRWHDRIDGVGQAVADRVLAWIHENEASLGRLNPSAYQGRLEVARSGTGLAATLIQQAAAARPNGEGRLATSPGALSVVRDHQTASHEVAIGAPQRLGTPGQGVYRRALSQPEPHECLIGAADDFESMQSWIKAKSGSPHTARVYRREVERLLLFLAQEKNIGLRSLLSDDLMDYRTFLSILGRVDAEHWGQSFRVEQSAYLAPRHIPRADHRWRPFEGPLSAKSAQFALGVVRSFLDYLVQVRYLGANPMTTLSIKLAPSDQRSTPKGLSRAQFALLLRFLDQLPDGHDAARKRFLIHFAYQSALRISEIALARTSHLNLVSREREAGHHLLLSVKGKGNKMRSVFLGDEVVRAWTGYAVWRWEEIDSPEQYQRLAAMRSHDSPLVATFDNKDLGVSRIYSLIKEIFSQCAEFVRGGAGHRNMPAHDLFEDAQSIEACSPHDLRHSRGRHLGQSALPLPILQRLMGHSSIATTGLYTTSSDLEMARALDSVDAAGRQQN